MSLNVFYARPEAGETDVAEAQRVLGALASVSSYNEEEDHCTIETSLSYMETVARLKKGVDLHVMIETLQIPERYTGVRTKVVYDKWIKHAVIPTRAEVDELYKELYKRLESAREISDKLQDFTTQDGFHFTGDDEELAGAVETLWAQIACSSW
jgi:hypothetical protein